MTWRPTRAQRAMMAKPSKRAIQQAIDAQRPLDAPERPKERPKRKVRRLVPDDLPEL